MGKSSIIKVRILGDSKGLAGALGDAESKVGGFVSKIGTLAQAGALAVGATVVAGLGKGFSDALGAEAVGDTIAGRLRVSSEEAASIAAAAAGAYRDAWGDSLESVANTATSIASSFDGLGQDDLERLIGQAEALGQTFQIDVDQAVQTSSELLSSGLVGSADEAFDLLTRGLQEMPQGIRDELFAASNEYGDFFADLGISGEEAFAALTSYATDGVYGIDKFGDALKELTIRGTDMSATSVAAYAAAGLSAEEMSAMFLAGGDQAREALDITAQALLDIEDPVARANAAIGLFGTPLEDLSVTEIPGFLEGLTDMGAGLGGVEGAAQDLADTVGDNAQAKLESFRRKALGKLADFATDKLLPAFERGVAWFEANWPQIQATGEQVLQRIKAAWDQYGRPVFDGLIAAARAAVDWVRTNWPQIQATIQAVVDWISTNIVPPVAAVVGFLGDQWQAAVDWTRAHWDQISATIDSVIGAIRVVIETTISVIQKAWELFGDSILAYAAETWENIKQVIGGVIEVIRGIIQTVTSLIRGDWSGAWDGIKSIVSGTWEAIKGIVSQAVNVVKTTLSVAWTAISTAASAAWDGITGLVSDGADAIVEFVTGLPGRLRDLADNLLAAGSALGGAIIDGLKNGLSKTVGFIGDIGAALLQAVKNVVNTQIIDRINSALEFTIGLGPLGSYTINPPDIPHIFHDGGWVGNPSGPPRDVPAILQQGEYVVSRDDAAAMRRRSAGGRQLVTNSYRLSIDGHEFNAWMSEQSRTQEARAA